MHFAFPATSTQASRSLRASLLSVALMAVGGALSPTPVLAQEGIALPALKADEGPSQVATEKAVFAGGCFWGVQGVFQHVKGVKNAVSGYAGGKAGTAQYETVSTGSTGHAEAVEITFDPRQVSYGKLLQVYFSAAHDPTTLNRQGPDHGTQYRSAIFPQTAEQAKVAAAYIEQLDRAKPFDGRIVTGVEQNGRFFAAEAYHQDFLTLNPDYPYIVHNDLPKLENLKRLFPDFYRADPALVSEAVTN